MNNKSLSENKVKLTDFFTRELIAEQAKKVSQKKVMIERLRQVTGSNNVIVARTK